MPHPHDRHDATRGPVLRACLVALVLVTPAARAGLYDPAAPASSLAGGKPLPHPVFFEDLTDELLIPLAGRNTKLRQQHLATLEQTKAATDVKGLVRRAHAQLRLRQTDAALDTLKRAEAQDPRDFGVLLLLAAAHAQAGAFAEAARAQEVAIEAMPTLWPGDPTQRAWFVAAEKLQQRLFRLRAREQERASRPVAATAPDDLFRVDFVGPPFQPGTLADAERAKLPPDAVALVQQLLLWTPDDGRLLWQLAEVLNATGDTRSAAAVYDELVGPRRFDAAALRAHRLAVRESLLPPPPPPAFAWLPRGGKLWGVLALGAAAVLGLAAMQFREWRRKRRG